MDIGPDGLELTIAVKDLDAVVLPVAYEHRAVIIDQQAVGQVEMARLRLARLSPGRLQLAVRREPVDPGIAIAVRDVEVTRRGGDQLAGVVEGTSCPGHQVAGVFASRVRMHPVAAQHLDRLAVQRVHDAHRIVAVSDVNGVVGDVDTVGELERPVPPRIQKISIPVEDHHRRVFPLKGVDPVLGIGGHGTHRLEGVARRQLRPVQDRFIGVIARTQRSHVDVTSLYRIA